MFDWLWAIIDFIQRRTVSFLGWCRDPWNGSRMTRPFSRNYTRTGESLMYIILHRTGSAIYSFLYILIFDGLATAARFVVGLLSDLWHSDYRYGRYVADLAAVGIKAAASVVVTGIMFVAISVETLFFEK